MGGGGGVDQAINKAGGKDLIDDRSKMMAKDFSNGKIPITGVGVTRGDSTKVSPQPYGSLKVHTVLHAVGPSRNVYKSEAEFLGYVRDVYRNTLETVHSLNTMSPDNK